MEQVLIREIANLPDDFHGAGSVSERMLTAIATHCGTEIAHSAETGCGRTTLLLSHISKDHTVFSVDDGKSMTAVRQSALLQASTVTFVEAPTQQSLPQHTFAHKLDLALIDGPHAYPFPDLEYFYLYPHIKAGGWLIVDDIDIPTIYNLVQFLKRDAMFELVETVGVAAFFQRTAAPTFFPFGDGWETQGYNAAHFPRRRMMKLWYNVKKWLPTRAVQAIKARLG